MGVIMRGISVLALLLFTDTYHSLPQHPTPRLHHDLDTPEIIAQAGYSPETHQVTTSDGYMLKIHRIPGEGPVVFCQHGLEDSSATCCHSCVEPGVLAVSPWLRQQHYTMG